MKIRIPLPLRAVLLSTAVLSMSSQAEAESIELELNTSTYTHNGSLVVSDDETVGYIEANNTLYGDTLKTIKGKPWKVSNFSQSKRTQDLTITGDLTINGNGKVAVGGGYGTSGTDVGRLRVENGTVTVNSSGYLAATIGTIKNLVVNDNARVELRTGGEGSDTYGPGSTSYYPGGKKQICISNSLSINGGKVVVGVGSGAYVKTDNVHYTSAFKGSISQTGGVMAVRGNSCLGSNLTINQTGSETSAMYFTDDLAVNSGNLTINQSNANSSLVIARLYGTGGKAVNINQSAGYVQLAMGAKFTKAATININQTGNGIIDIGGGISKAVADAAERNDNTSTYYAERRGFFDNNAAFAIEQSGMGGNINLKAAPGLTNCNEAASITVSKLNQSSGNTITVEKGASMTISADTATIDGKLVNSGSVTANKLSIGGTFLNESDAKLTVTSISFTDGGVLTNNGELLIDEIDLENVSLKGSGTYKLNSDITMDNGTVEFTLVDAVLAPDSNGTAAFAGTVLDLNGNNLTIGSEAEIALCMSGEVQSLFESMLADDSMAPVDFTMQVARGIGNIDQLDLDALLLQTTHTAYMTDVFYSKDGDGNLYVSGTLAPEPTTATLSLLALAALSARRRRR